MTQCTNVRAVQKLRYHTTNKKTKQTKNAAALKSFFSNEAKIWFN